MNSSSAIATLILRNLHAIVYFSNYDISAAIQRHRQKWATWITPTSQELHQAPLQSLHSPSARAPSLPARGTPACTCINNLLNWLHNSRIFSSPRRRKPSKWHYPLLSSFAPLRPPSRPSPLPWLSGQPEREECETIFQVLGEFARFTKSRCYVASNRCWLSPGTTQPCLGRLDISCPPRPVCEPDPCTER